MNVAILLWEEVELLSFTGPGALFNRAGGEGAFFVYTVAETRRPITSEDFLTIVPEYTIHQCPRPEVLVIPAGGAFYVVHRKPVLDWIRQAAETAQAILAVSEGARILGSAGVLDVPGSTSRDSVEVVAPDTKNMLNGRSILEQGKITVAVSNGDAIEAALRIIARLGG